MFIRLLLVATILGCLLLGFTLGCDGQADNNLAEPVPELRHAVLEATLTETLAVTDEKFLSFAVDASQVVGGNWWSDEGNATIGVGDEQVDPYDFSRPRLRNLAKELAPAYLRVGGSEADKLYYDLSDQPLTEAPEGFDFVFTRAMWDGVNGFAKDLGLEVFFTLNAGPGPRDARGNWTPDNARVLLEYTRDHNYPVTFWELGNEVSAYILQFGVGDIVGGGQYADDMRALAALRDEVTPFVKIGGPSSAYWPRLGEMLPFLTGFLVKGGDSVDVVTWHYYPQQSRRCPFASRNAKIENMFEPGFLDEVNIWAEQVQQASTFFAPQAEVWLGETGNAQCGGEPEVSDTFAASFWWLDQLGLIAARGQKITVRQTLSGGDYELIDEQTLEPHPDYWASVLWKRLMGAKVLALSATQDDRRVRAYAHCAVGRPGAVTFLVLNLDKRYELAVDFGALAGLPFKAYVVATDDLAGRHAILNGTLLESDEQGNIPSLPAVNYSGEVPLVLPPASYAFVVIPAADAPACR